MKGFTKYFLLACCFFTATSAKAQSADSVKYKSAMEMQIQEENKRSLIPKTKNHGMAVVATSPKSKSVKTIVRKKKTGKSN